MSDEEWKQELESLETFFGNKELPTGPVNINSFSIIHDLRAYVTVNLGLARANIGQRWFIGSLYRLRELRKYLEAL